MLSEEKKGPHLKIYKLKNNNKVIEKFKSTGMGKKKINQQNRFSVML